MGFALSVWQLGQRRLHGCGGLLVGGFAAGRPAARWDCIKDAGRMLTATRVYGGDPGVEVDIATDAACGAEDSAP